MRMRNVFRDPYMDYIYGSPEATPLERHIQHNEEASALLALESDEDAPDEGSDPLSILLAREEAGEDVFHSH